MLFQYNNPYIFLDLRIGQVILVGLVAFSFDRYWFTLWLDQPRKDLCLAPYDPGVQLLTRGRPRPRPRRRPRLLRRPKFCLQSWSRIQSEVRRLVGRRGNFIQVIIC